MTGTKTHESGTPKVYDPLREYISAKEVAQKKLQSSNATNNARGTNGARSVAAFPHDSIKRSGSTNSCLATNSARSFVNLNSPTASMSMSMSLSATSSPRCSSPSLSDHHHPQYVLKVVLIGDSGVGKSNLIMRFTKNKFQTKSSQTVGFEFASKTIRVGEQRIKAQIWDTAGQDRFQSLTAAYYRNAVGAMIVYDITNRASFENVTKWLNQVQENAHESLVMVLVGNKCDLAHLPNTRQVSTLEAARFASKNNMEFLETSALDSTNVVDAFKKIIVPVGRLLLPSNPGDVVRLPPGWRRVLSRTRPGEYSYENQYTKERIAFAPKEPAKPSQQSFRPPGSNGTMAITVTRESLQLQHQKALLAQANAPQCGACSTCVIL